MWGSQGFVRPLLLSAIVGAVAAVAVGVVIATGALDTGPTGPQPPKPPTVGAPPLPSGRPPVPSLTEEQIFAAKDLFAKDPRVGALLQGRTYTVKRVGPWVSKDHKLIGAVLEAELHLPATLEGEWPDIKYDTTEAAWPPYEETTQRFRAEGLVNLYASVDLGRNKVVNIVPGRTTNIVPTP